MARACSAQVSSLPAVVEPASVMISWSRSTDVSARAAYVVMPAFVRISEYFGPMPLMIVRSSPLAASAAGVSSDVSVASVSTASSAGASVAASVWSATASPASSATASGVASSTAGCSSAASGASSATVSSVVSATASSAPSASAAACSSA